MARKNVAVDESVASVETQPETETKRTRKCKIETDFDAMRLTFAWPDQGVDRVVELSMIPQALHPQLALHGVKQKLSDVQAGKDPVESIGLFDKLLDALKSGDFGTRIGRSGEDSVDLLVSAIFRAKLEAGQSADADAIRARVESADRSTRAKMRAIPAVAAILATMRGAKMELDEI